MSAVPQPITPERETDIELLAAEVAYQRADIDKRDARILRLEERVTAQAELQNSVRVGLGICATLVERRIQADKAFAKELRRIAGGL